MSTGDDNDALISRIRSAGGAQSPYQDIIDETLTELENRKLFDELRAMPMPSPPSVESRLAEVGERFEQLARTTSDAGNPAASDAWLLALDLLRQVQASVIRARTASDRTKP